LAHNPMVKIEYEQDVEPQVQRLLNPFHY
jgi:hypothetical protein